MTSKREVVDIRGKDCGSLKYETNTQTGCDIRIPALSLPSCSSLMYLKAEGAIRGSREESFE